MRVTDTHIGQMLIFGFHGAYPQETKQIIHDIKAYRIAGVWLTDNNSPLGETRGNIVSPKQLKDLTSHLQAASEIPLFVAIDAEGGAVIRLKEPYGFPPTHSARYLGTKNDTSFTNVSYVSIVRQLKELGINFNFAPVVDLNLAPDNPALGGKERCFSANPATVIAHARAAVDAHRQLGILTCLKHFPGHGSARDDSHLGMVDITKSWQPREMLPFKTLIDEDRADAVLVAHVINKNIDPENPASLSSSFIHEQLQKKLGFDGLVVSDDLNMGAIQNYYSPKETLARAINAGTDILVFSNLRPYRADLIGKTVKLIKTLLSEGRISEQTILNAGQKIKNTKQKHGLI